MDDPIRIGEWVRVSQLGAGGFGIVTLWRNVDTEEQIAVKKCKWQDSSQLTDRQRERWISEVRMMQEMKNNNIVKYVKLPVKLDLCLSRNNPSKLPILSMEYCSKGNLRHVLTEKPENLCGLPDQEAKTAILDIANAINYLHGLKITHRDIKPENIVLQHCNNRPNKIIYKLIDLGYAKELNSICASFVGTLQYLAPEILQGNQYNCSVDYFSFGIVVFEIITGFHPFLPFAPLPDRIEHLSKKDKKDIYFYTKKEGGVKYCSELPKEIHLSPSLKLPLEKWLREVLQYNPLRASNYKVFEELALIFTKKIIKVFSVYTYEFYHYEINNYTLMSTVQDWFFRDTKIEKSEQFVLSNCLFKNHDHSECKAIDCCVEGCNNVIIIFKRNETINKAARPFIPKLVKKLFNNLQTKSYKWDDLKIINGHAIYYIHQERELYQYLFVAFKLFFGYINKAVLIENEKIKEAKRTGTRLLTEINCLNTLSKSLAENIKVVTKDLVNNIQIYKQILQEASNSTDSLNGLIRKHIKLMENKKIFDFREMYSLRQYDLNSQYNEAIHFAKTGKKEGEKVFSSKEILKIIDTTLKTRHQMLKHIQENQYSYFKCAWEIWKRSHRYIVKAQCLDNYLKEISKKLLSNERDKYCILFNINNTIKNTQNQGNELLQDIDMDSVLTFNINLRYSLQEEINKSLIFYKTNLSAVEYLSSLVNNI